MAQKTNVGIYVPQQNNNKPPINMRWNNTTVAAKLNQGVAPIVIPQLNQGAVPPVVPLVPLVPVVPLVPATAGTIKIPTPTGGKTKKEVEEEKYREEIKEKLDSIITNQQTVIEALEEKHRRELEAVKAEMRQILKEVMDNNAAQINTMLINMQAIVQSHNNNNAETNRMLGRMEEIYRRIEEEEKMNELEERIDEIKMGQQEVNGAMQTLGAQVIEAVTVPTRDKGKFNISGSEIIRREDATTLTVEQLTEIITKTTKNEYMYKKRQETNPNRERERSIEIMRINKEMLKEVREEKKGRR